MRTISEKVVASEKKEGSGKLSTVVYRSGTVLMDVLLSFNSDVFFYSMYVFLYPFTPAELLGNGLPINAANMTFALYLTNTLVQLTI
jgi:hypothetical protein